MANGIADAWLRSRWKGADEWKSDRGSRGAGQLVARKMESGVMFYFRHFTSEGKNRALPIGPYDSSGARGLTLFAARDKAGDLSRLYRSGVRDLREHFDAQHAAAERARRSEDEARKREEEDAKRSTLHKLLDAYTSHLERQGKPSARDARNIFKLHVIEAAPELAERKADIPGEDFVPLISALVEAGHGRTAAKLRSYLSAAYASAMGSRTDPAAPQDLRAFGIRINPIASISAKSLARFNLARDRRLSAEELSALLKRLDGMEADARRDAVLLSLYLGGQRPAQLLRARAGEVDLSAATITLYDPKGSRKQPRRHVLPLTRKAIAVLKRRLEAIEAAAKKRAEAKLPEKVAARESDWLFSLDGMTALRPETLSGYVSEISKAMVKAKETREPFELRDLRRTCETMLAALKVSSDVRAMILSHGLGGIQKRHYDFHDYALEMRAALEKWAKHLDQLAAGKVAKVVHGDFGKAKQHA